MVDKTAVQQHTVPDTHDNDDNSVTASQLSALVDDELERRECDLLVRRLCRDAEMQARWERYHLIRDAMQGHLPDAFDTQLVPRIRQAVETEPLPQPAATLRLTWYQPATRWGLAASVVVVALFGLKQVWTDSPIATATRQASLSSVPMSGVAMRLVAGSQHSESAKGPAEERLNTYLASHNGFASRSNMQGMLPFVRMVGYQNPR